MSINNQNNTNFKDDEKQLEETDKFFKLQPSYIPDGCEQNLISKEKTKLFKQIRDIRTKQILEKYESKIPNETTDENKEYKLHEKINLLSDYLIKNNFNDEALLNDLLELKKMHAYEKQKNFKGKMMSLLQGLVTQDQINTSIDYINPSYSVFSDIKLMESFEMKYFMKEQQCILDKQLTFCREIAKMHKILVVNKINDYKTKIEKTYRLLNLIHVNCAKEEQKRKERETRDKIRNLKANDEQAYQRFLKENKQKRIDILLERTDEYISEIFKRLDIYKKENDKNFSSIIAKTKIEMQPSSLNGTLKDYQLKGIEWLVNLYDNNLNGILADEMGLGKTVQTIGFISYLAEFRNINGPYLIVVPLSTCSNWSNEFKRWNSNFKVIEYIGNAENRRNQQGFIKEGKMNVVLTTYEYIIKDKNFLSRIEWCYLIVDEGHRLKNKDSKLAAVFNSKYKSRNRLVLTGTPLQNNLPELWSILNFVLPQIFNSLSTFEEWFNAPLSFTNEKIEITEEEIGIIIKKLHTVLRPFLLRRLKKDVASELPSKVEIALKVKMSRIQRTIYNELKKKSNIKFLTNDQPEKENISDENEFDTEIVNEETKSNRGIESIFRSNNICMQLRKICNHPFIFKEIEQKINPMGHNNHLLFTLSGKFELLSKILPKFQLTGHRILIFFQMTQIMTIMEDFLCMLGYKYLRLDGNKKGEERTQLIDTYNNDTSYFVFLLSTRSGGLGINLTSADTVIIFDSDWNPHADLQAQDRVHRIGQEKEVKVFRLISENSIEEYMLEKAVYKLNLDIKIIRAGRFDQITEFKENMKNNDKENYEKSLDDLYVQHDINRLLARSDSEYAIFEDIDKKNTLPELDLENDFNIFENNDVINHLQDQDNKRFKTNAYDDQMKYDEKPKRETLFNSLYQQKDGTRSRINIFLDLPSKKHYADYYQIIKNPISMNMILKKLKNEDYNFDRMLEDLNLLFDNAMMYNIEGSEVYEDALFFKNYIQNFLDCNK